MTPSNFLPPCDFVIFGGTGDLAKRKLLPALYMYEREGRLPPRFRIIAVSREPWDDGKFHEQCDDSIKGFIGAAWDASTWNTFSERLQHVEAQLKASEWRNLAATLQAENPPMRVFYMALPSSLMSDACDGLKNQNLVHTTDRVVLEKPIGTRLEGAQMVQQSADAAFGEDRIYRIDHYLGKQTVMGLTTLRPEGSLLAFLWNNTSVKCVEILASEEEGVGDRILLYDEVGALRDMVQSHLLQILCLVAMDPPGNGSRDLRDAKCAVLDSLEIMAKGDDSMRGRYAACNGKRGYVDEVADVDTDGLRVASTTETETFVALRAKLTNTRWGGVPFILRTGKQLKRKETQVVVHFTDSLEPNGAFTPRILVIHLHPDNGAELLTAAKDSPPLELHHFPRNFPNIRTPEAYERLLADVVNGDHALFVSLPEVEKSWKWIDRIRDLWNGSHAPPLTAYDAGTEGPSTARWIPDGSSL